MVVCFVDAVFKPATSSDHVMRLSMLAPTRDRVVNFPWNGRLAPGVGILNCKVRMRNTPRVSRQDLNSKVARWVGQLNSN